MTTKIKPKIAHLYRAWRAEADATASVPDRDENRFEMHQSKLAEIAEQIAVLPASATGDSLDYRLMRSVLGDAVDRPNI